MLYSTSNEYLMSIRSIQIVIVLAVLGIGGTLWWMNSSGLLFRSSVTETESPPSDTLVSDSASSGSDPSTATVSSDVSSSSTTTTLGSDAPVSSAPETSSLPIPQDFPSSTPSPSAAPTTDTPSVSSQAVPQEISSSSPQYKKEMVNGIVEFSRYAAYQEKVILDGLLIPEKVAQLTTLVRWTTSEGIQVDDAKAVKTFFIAPSEQKELVFQLEVLEGEQYNMAGTFRFKIVSPQVIKADVNQDGNYDFTDLLNLLQHWQDFGTESTQIMGFILSQYRP